MLAVPCSTIMAGTESAAGPELQRLPPRLARPWIATPPMTDDGLHQRRVEALHGLVVIDDVGGRGCADGQAAVGVVLELLGFGDGLDVYEQLDLAAALAGLDDDVCATGEDPGGGAALGPAGTTASSTLEALTYLTSCKFFLSSSLQPNRIFYDRN